jgi:hypothetical protein
MTRVYLGFVQLTKRTPYDVFHTRPVLALQLHGLRSLCATRRIKGGSLLTLAGSEPVVVTYSSHVVRFHFPVPEIKS